MRPKFVFALLLFTFLILGGALFLKQYLGGGLKPSANAESVASVPPVNSNVVAMAAPPREPAPASLPVAPLSTNTAMPPTNTVAPEPSQEAIDAEVNRLQDWSLNDDPESLSNILADLTNSVKEVREAAIDAAEQFGSTNAIPALKAAAQTTDDLQEKIAYLEAADFLSLPSLPHDSQPAKTLEQMKAEAQAKHAQDSDRQNQRAAPHTGPNPDSGSTSPPP
jgi:hypothetical protein